MGDIPMIDRQHGPEQMAVVGTFLLAQAINERIQEKKDLPEAAAFVAELLSLMLKARGALLELPRDILPNPIRIPEGLAPSMAPRLQATSYPIVVDQTPIGYLHLYFSEHEPPIILSDATTAQFALNSLAKLAASALAVGHKFAKLTPTEERVLGLMALPTAEILSQLGIGHETFRSHSKRIFSKLGVKSRKEALQLLQEATLSFEPDRAKKPAPRSRGR